MPRIAFGKTESGQAIDLFIFRNPSGMEVKVTNYGATLVSVRTPDRNGHIAEVCLGFDHLEDYLGPHPHFGGVVGRFGNRIAGGQFSLEGKDYQLAVNNGSNHLHGGLVGFDRRIWEVLDHDEHSVRLGYLSPDGEEGYPGTLTAEVRYELTAEDAVRIDYDLGTDAPTIANLTNHSYFNLRDEGRGNILSHELQLFADFTTPVDEHMIPNGDLWSVADTPFDFRMPKPIGADIEADDEQLRRGKGYDHNFVLNGESGQLRLCAIVYEPDNGRLMEVETTEPGVQFYTANHVNLKGRNDIYYHPRSAFCLETQHYPDSPNQVGFPSTTIRPGKGYHSTTVYRFSAR